MLYIKRNFNGRWYVHSFISEHNHEVYRDHAHYFPCHKSITSLDKQKIDTLYTVGVGTNKIFVAMAKQSERYQNVSCLEKNIWNHIDKKKDI